ncbi:MAG: SDR family oxidoreductase, partial [Saprospiraceae bacterium]
MRYIVITGATKGIGRAVAEEFAKAGNHLFICSRNRQDLQSTAEALRLLNANTTVDYLVSDLSKQDEVAKFASEIKEHFPYLDILVNNAGLFISGNIVNEAEGALEAMLQVN